MKTKYPSVCKHYKISYTDGSVRLVHARNILQVVHDNDLCTIENCHAKVEEIE
jgi:hypothetical protein